MRILAAVAVSTCLAGCATTSGNQLADNSGSAGSSSSTGYYDNVDWVKMTRITRDAETRGSKIWWVNPPQKPPAARQAAGSGR
jgi:hypothetical protein